MLEKNSFQSDGENADENKRRIVWDITTQCRQSLCSIYIICLNSGQTDMCSVCFSLVTVPLKPMTLEILSFQLGEIWRYDYWMQLSGHNAQKPEECAVLGSDPAPIPAEQLWHFPLAHQSSYCFFPPGIFKKLYPRHHAFAETLGVSSSIRLTVK